MILGNPAALKAAVPAGARLIGLDLGTKTIGLALSDTRLVIASPLDTIRRRRFRDDMAALFGEIDRHGIGGVVIGGGKRVGWDGRRGGESPFPRCWSMLIFLWAMPPTRRRRIG